MMGLASHWLWLIGAAVLAAAELVAPGVYLIWIGAAAFITGVAALALPIPIAGQFALFAISAFVAIYVGRRYFMQNPIQSDDPLLNDRSARLIGTIVTAIEPVDSSQGRVKVGDSIWSARGSEAATGDRLRVVSVEGGVLIVEPA